MKEQLTEIKENALVKLAQIQTSEELEVFRVDFLGKKGALTQVLGQMGKLSAEERPVIGQIANEIRILLEDQIKIQRKNLYEIELTKRLETEKLDVTLPGNKPVVGKKHPLNVVLDEIKEILTGMGFSLAQGPEVEYDYYNFEALNIPKHHPARDTQDTFYFTPEILLRTQTSCVQVRTMEKQQPPIRIFAPGRVYRLDDFDATHSPVFTQIEGLVIDKGITMANLKGILDTIAKKLFGNDIKSRFRPDYFPFTEPSAEMAISCFMCGGAGCKFCKHEGWIELLGAGMVNPKVLKLCGIDPDIYSGFAFGMGLERLVMKRFNIDDIRMLFENDVRFLNSL